MNILVISSSYPRFENDQIGFFIHELNKQLNEHHCIFVLVPSFNGKFEEDVIDNIKIYRFKQIPFIKNGLIDAEFGILETIKRKPFRSFLLLFYLLNLIRATIKILGKHKIDIIHYHWIFPSAIIQVIIKFIFKNLKSVVTIHGSDFWSFDKGFLKSLKYYILSHIDFLITVNKSMVKDLKIHKKNKSVPMGIYTNIFRPIYQNYNSDIVNLLFVGKANKAKGFDNLIDSIKILVDKKIDVNLVAVTQSIDENIFNDFKRKDILTNINLTGRILNNETINYYNGAEIFVLPSLSEGWPVVVMEALSCGCICIVTDIPAFEEYKDKYEFLHVIEKSNPQALADKILQIHNNFEYFKTFKMQARDFAVNNFDWSIITKKYLDVYEELIKNEN